MIKYEMITGHFTAQGRLYGWNSVVVSDFFFPALTRLAWE